MDGPDRRQAQVSVDHAVSWCMAAKKVIREIRAADRSGATDGAGALQSAVDRIARLGA